MVVVVSLKLAKASIADLLDSVPPELCRRVATVAKIPEVREVKHVRMRRSGPGLFIDLTLVMDAGESLDHSHELSDKVEAALKAEFARADVVIHLEPAAMSTVDLATATRRLAERHGSSAHNIRVFEQQGREIMELHLEMPESLPLAEAHQRASMLENDLRATLPSLSQIITHIEPAEAPAATRDAEPAEVERINQCLMRFPELAAMGISAHDLHVRRTEGALAISFHCTLAATTSIKEAHAFTQRVEQFLRAEIHGLGRVIVHCEPPEEH